jgi:hypothetical protein
MDFTKGDEERQFPPQVKYNKSEKEKQLRQCIQEFLDTYPHWTFEQARQMVWFNLVNPEHWTPMKWFEFRVYEKYRKNQGWKPSRGPGYPGAPTQFLDTLKTQEKPTKIPTHFNISGEDQEETPRSHTSEAFHKVPAPVPQWTGRDEDLPAFQTQVEQYRMLHPASPVRMQDVGNKRVPDSPLQ